MANLRAGTRTPPSTRRIIRAISAAAITRGYPVKTDGGSPPKVQDATDGDAVYGIATTATDAADQIVFVIVEGPAVLAAASGASWASHRRVVAAGSGEVDEGTSGDPYFATLISHDGTDDTADVYVHADALQTVGRALVSSADVVYPIGALTANEPLVLTGGAIASTRRIGTTAQRPGSPYDGQEYYDSDISDWMTYDGTNWISSVQRDVGFGYSRGTAVTTATMGWAWAVTSADTGVPWHIHRDATIVEARFSLMGPVGGSTWTPGIRVNGSGSNAWTGTGRVSTTSWVSFAETPALSVSAGDRLFCRGAAGGGGAGQCSLILYYVYT